MTASVASFKVCHTIPQVLGWGDGQRDGPCPRCGGVTKVHFDPKKRVAFCHGCNHRGDVLDWAAYAEGQTIGQILADWSGGETMRLRRMPHNRVGRPDPIRTTRETPKRQPKLTGKHYGQTIRYPYTTAAGRIVGAACRRDWEAADAETGEVVRGKDCWQCGHDGDRWTRTLNGAVLPCYNLPAIAANPELVMVAEGEPCVEALLGGGAVATTNAGGAGKWTLDHSNQLAALEVKRVVILPDADTPGMDHALSVAQHCKAEGIETVILPPRLWGLGVYEAHGPDVADWLERGGTVHLLLAVIRDDAPIGDLIRHGGGDFDRTLCALEAWAEREAIVAADGRE